jgi:hypothetical protein
MLQVGFVLVHALQKRKLEAMPNPTHSIPDEKNLPDRMRSLRIALLNLQQSLAPLQVRNLHSLIKPRPSLGMAGYNHAFGGVH